MNQICQNIPSPAFSGGRSDENIAALMTSFRAGDKKAANQLVDHLYPELLRLACTHMNRERSGHIWQPAVLVNELYVQLMKVKLLPRREFDTQDEKAAFLGLASHLMRRLLIHHARPLSHRVERVEIEDALDLRAPDPGTDGDVEKILSGLASVDPRFRIVVELRVFEGVTREEIARRMGCAPRTVARCWESAKHLLKTHMRAGRPSPMYRPSELLTSYGTR